MKIEHICFRVKDLEKSVNFYKDAFGFKETRRRDFAEHKFTLVYMAMPGDDREIELTYNYDHPGYTIGDGFSHIAITTNELEKMHEKHKKAGFKVSELSGLPNTPPSYYFITDPDGYQTEVVLRNYVNEL